MPTSTAVQSPSVDLVSIPGAGPQAGKALGLSVSCELMHNHLPGSPVEPTTDIAVVQDVAGNPMIFSIGADKALRLIRTDPGSPTGFNTVDLTAGFTGSGGAAAFDVSEDLKGNITVVVAMLRNAGPATNLFIAPMLSNDPARTDWAGFFKVAVPVAGIDPAFAATRILMGNSDDGQAPFVTVVGDLGSQEVYYQLAHADHPACRFAFPENVPSDSEALLDLSIGYAFGERGVWYLYTSGTGQTLECTTLASADSGPLTYDYSPGYKGIPQSWRYNCIATPTGQNANPFNISSDVYVGCDDGIRVFVGGRTDALPQTVAADVKDVHQLIVKQDANGIAVWALCSPDRLYYIYGHKGTPYRWNAPVLFARDVVHLAPMRVRTRNTNELFVVTSDLSVVHHWQDPNSTLWQQRVIRTADSDYLVNVPTFTTRLHVEDADGNPLAGAVLDVTASEWTYVTINGLVYALDRDVALPVTVDELGSVTIIGLAADIAPPILHVASSNFEGVVNIYANGKIQAGLQAIRSGADLKNARTAKGLVVDPSTSQDTLDGVASNLGQLTDAAGGYVAGTRPAGTTFAAVDGAKHTGALSVAHLPSSFAVGMKVQNGAWQPHPDAKAAVAAVAASPSSVLGGVIDDIEAFVGDALHWLETAFEDGIALVEKGVTKLKDGVSFVIHKVEDGLQFVLDLAGKTLTLAINTFGAAFKALNWILNLIKVGLEDVLAWLGHLFGWDDIWKAHKIIANVLTSGLDCAADRASREIETWRAAVKDEFDSAATRVKDFLVPADLSAVQPRRSAASEVPAGAHAASRAPASTFTAYQVRHGGMMDGPSLSRPTPTGNIDSIGKFFSDVVAVEVDKINDALEKVGADVYNLFVDASHTVDQLLNLLNDIIDVVLDVAAAIVDGALALAELMINEIRNLLETEIDLPFISAFYGFVTGLLGESETLTAINAMALLIAIPVVEGCRIAGVTAFDGGMDVMSDPGLLGKVTRGPGALQVASSLAAPGSRAALGPMMMMADPDPSPHSPTAAEIYTRWGSLVGAFAGNASSWIGLVNVANPTPNVLAAIAAGAGNVIRVAGTFPTTLPPFKTISWSITALMTALDIMAQFIPPPPDPEDAIVFKQTVVKVRGAFAGMRGASGLVLSLVEDILAKPTFLVFGADIASNVGALGTGAGMLSANTGLAVVSSFPGVVGAIFALSYAIVKDHPLDALSNAGG